MKEATARIKINKLLESAGWRFFADEKGPANIQLEPGVKLSTSDVDKLGADFEKASTGFIDFLLLNIPSLNAKTLRAAKPRQDPSRNFRSLSVFALISSF